MLSDVGGRERAQRDDRLALGSEIGEHARHQAVGHALAPPGRIGFDVRHDDRRFTTLIVGDGDDVAVDDEFVALAIGVVSDLVFHDRSVTRKVARSAPHRP